MNDQAKNNLKAVALSLGIVLIIASVVVIIYKQYQKGKDDSTDDTNPYLPLSKSAHSPSQTPSQSSFPNYFNQGYTKAEVERMQGWLFSTATLKHNEIIVKAIRDNGGIDGKMGSGFKIALKEAIRVGYVKDLKDLEIKSKS